MNALSKFHPFFLKTSLVLSCLLLGLVPSSQSQVTRDDLLRMEQSEGKEYRALRDAIVEQGESVVPFLQSEYDNRENDWRIRFAAGVCLEHIQRHDDLQALFHYDWWSIPGFSTCGPILATGYPRGCGKFVHEKELELGLWFYYMELYSAKTEAGYDTRHSGIIGRARTVLVDWGTGDVRYFTACLAGEYFMNHAVHGGGIGPQTEVYLKDLDRFIKDGTYPEGRRILENYLDVEHPIVLAILTNEYDIAVLNRYMEQFGDDFHMRVNIGSQIGIAHYRMTNAVLQTPLVQTNQADVSATGNAEPEEKTLAADDAPVPRRRSLWIAAAALLLCVVWVLFRRLGK